MTSLVDHGSQQRLRAAWWRREERVAPYLYVAPFLVIFLVFGVFTIGYTLWVSLHDWHVFGGREFVGLANYLRLAEDPRFWRAVQNTFSILLLSTLPQMVVGLIVAELLSDRFLRAPHLFRSSLLVPNITSVVAIAIVFQSLFGRHFGLVNMLLETVGFGGVDWYSSRFASHVAIASMVNWQWTGYNAIIFLAAMQGIPKDLYEAAMVDGAGRVQRFWRITVPQVRPALLFVTVVSVIGNLQLFAQPLLFGAGSGTTGGADNQYLTILLYLYNQAFRQFRFGYASAIAWTLVMLTALCSLVVFGLFALRNYLDDREPNGRRSRRSPDPEIAREVRP
ncbi:carbohydrate ABC transporter permease [Nitriliruptor alkaliphilus]|uniref:carbohydrate ABC transporter permease n=1 Tax=Nitriliruptor alkaliphilus TaxID=427918 RepID=UPI000A9D9E1D|nr:sugar ABC transporter permease [Nitriliruptor alkaliphilus]